ncbi:unnamed protein product [Oppiella nova]|uniref:BTB domain-containing protein n=1 Tax=Oppiella nova TaxID=334625 RepID=A0A7R9QDX0_9ACAR|nr:unnamed protein product [Oppiella nova]CAG2163934.1 unnamed protein product [Oppiella nova]
MASLVDSIGGQSPQHRTAYMAKHALVNGHQSGVSHVSHVSHGVSPATAPASVPAFVLRLPDHQKELHRFIGDLFDSQTHTDVTIALDDGQYIKAHKLILSAFSSYFRQVLARIPNPSQYPVIVVKDMHYEDVRSLIEFIYRGCITVANHRLPQVLKCAKQLKIRGLYETNEENSDENNFDNSFANCRNISQTLDNTTTAPTNSPTTSPAKPKDYQSYDNKKLDQKEVIVLDRNESLKANTNSRVSPESGNNNWYNKASVLVPNPPKFTIPALNHHPQPIQQRSALDLTKPTDSTAATKAQYTGLPVHTIHRPLGNGYSGGGGHFTSHPSLFRSTSVDECQLMKNKLLMANGFHERRAPSSLDGHLDDNNNSVDESDYRREKKRSLNIFHAAKYRNRKKQQLETLFTEEQELQRSNSSAKIQIEKLEATILSLIWQQTKRPFSGQTVFTCPVCGNVQNEVQKLRSHINMLHNDTEALMKFLMLQRSPTFATAITTAAAATARDARDQVLVSAGTTTHQRPPQMTAIPGNSAGTVISLPYHH